LLAAHRIRSDQSKFQGFCPPPENGGATATDHAREPLLIPTRVQVERLANGLTPGEAAFKRFKVSQVAPHLPTSSSMLPTTTAAAAPIYNVIHVTWENGSVLGVRLLIVDWTNQLPPLPPSTPPFPPPPTLSAPLSPRISEPVAVVQNNWLGCFGSTVVAGGLIGWMCHPESHSS